MINDWRLTVVDWSPITNHQSPITIQQSLNYSIINSICNLQSAMSLFTSSFLVLSLTGVAAFALASWLRLPPLAWFGVAFAAALPFLWQRGALIGALNIILLTGSLALVYRMESGSLWSPYYRITVFQDQRDTVVEVNHIFHQSMAPVDSKEYFYQWPYAVFGDTLGDGLIL